VGRACTVWICAIHQFVLIVIESIAAIALRATIRRRSAIQILAVEETVTVVVGPVTTGDFGLARNRICTIEVITVRIPITVVIEAIVAVGLWETHRRRPTIGIDTICVPVPIVIEPVATLRFRQTAWALSTIRIIAIRLSIFVVVDVIGAVDLLRRLPTLTAHGRSHVLQTHIDVGHRAASGVKAHIDGPSLTSVSRTGIGNGHAAVAPRGNCPAAHIPVQGVRTLHVDGAIGHRRPIVGQSIHRGDGHTSHGPRLSAGVIASHAEQHGHTDTKVKLH